MASSTEEVSGPMNDLSGGSRRDEGTTEQFGVFKDFDFLEYESESVEVRISFMLKNFIPATILIAKLFFHEKHTAWP
jgi:hypothetical protein